MNIEEKIMKVLAPLVAEAKEEIYSRDAQNIISDAKCLGVIVSKFLEYDINAVAECAKASFEDANFHDGVKVLNKLEEIQEALLDPSVKAAASWAKAKKNLESFLYS